MHRVQSELPMCCNPIMTCFLGNRAQAGCAGCVCSNHGGRQLDTARSGIEILEEIVPALDAAGISREVG